MADHRNVAERIADALKQSIVKGKLQPGDALPSERDLAEKFEVNRSSIREAVKRLQGWGLVQVRHGGATRVKDFLLSASVDLLPSLVEVGAVEPGILRDLHEIRGMLLGWCAERAAVLADGASLQRLEQLVRGMEAAKAKPSMLQELDYDFFDALVQISGNRLLGLVSNVVRDVYMKAPGRFLALYAKDVFDPAHHRRALEAIRSHNTRAAGEAMRAHAATALETT